MTAGYDKYSEHTANCQTMARWHTCEIPDQESFDVPDTAASIADYAVADACALLVTSATSRRAPVSAPPATRNDY
jgi:hypothetical protein